MAVYRFEAKTPTIGKETYVAESAEVIGDVVIGDNCYVGPGSRIRGDYGRIEIGRSTSIEENCVLHARPNELCRVGDHVTVGHGAILHNCNIRNCVVVGMGAIVSDYCDVGEWAVVGEGAVVKNSTEIPPGKIAVGVPAKVVADVVEEYKQQWTGFKDIYVDLARRYPKGLERID